MNMSRNITAAILMFLVFLMIPIYLDFIGVEPPKEHVEKDKPQQFSPRKNESQTISSNFPAPRQLDIKEKIINITTELFELQLSNRSGGSMLNYKLIGVDNEKLQYTGSYDELGEYYEDGPVLLHADLLNLGCSPCLSIDGGNAMMNEPFELITPLSGEKIVLLGDEELQLHYRFENELGDFIDRKIVLVGNSYNIDSNIHFNLSKTYPNKDIELLWSSGIMPAEKMVIDELSYSGAYISSQGDIEYISQTSTGEIKTNQYREGHTDWFAIRNKFFALSIFPDMPSHYSTLSSKNVVFGEREVTPIYQASLGYKMNQGLLNFTTYLGPLDVDWVNKFNPEVQLIMNFGWSIIQPFSKLVLWLLKIMREALGINYGVILILFALLMRIVTGPLTRKGYESSIKMKTVAPLQKEIQEKYKNDPQKLQQELGKLWKKHGFNPAMSCMAPLLQMPLLMAFFIVFRSTVEFRGQPFFGWITDLSQPDYIFSLPFSIPMYGSAVAILPILMGISMFLTMRVSMQSAEESQKYVMYFMNGFFILIFNTFPSGLTLYYTVYNFLSYQQQLSIKKNS